MIGDQFTIYSNYNLPGLEVRYHELHDATYLVHQGETIGEVKTEQPEHWAEGFFAALLTLKEQDEDNFYLDGLMVYYKQLYPLNKNDKGNS